MTSGSAASIEAVVSGLHATPVGLADAVPSLPREAGLYAWWAAPDVFAALPGPANRSDPGVRLLYLGIATNLRRRIAGNHLARSGTSTLRRTLAGLLLPTERYRTTRTNRVVLVAEDEQRLTAWMQAELRLTWFACDEPRRHEIAMITALEPPLNVEGAAPSEVRDLVVAAKAAYAAGAGPR